MRKTRRKFRNHILEGTALLFFGSCLASCTSQEPAEPSSAESYSLSIRITTDGIFSRSTWEDDWGATSDGSPFDQMISSLDLFIVDADANLTPLYALEEPGSSAKVYTCNIDERTPGVTINNSERTATFSGKIMAVANVEDTESPWGESAGWLTKKIPYSVNFGKSDTWKIPMWGIQTFQNITIRANELKHIGDIPMLRAVSKIVIKLDDSISGSEGYEITSVEMAEDSQLLKGKGFALPDGAMDVVSTSALTRDGCMALRPDASELEDPKFQKGTDSLWYTYVSESRVEDTSKPFAFKVTLKSKSGSRPEFSGLLYLATYQANRPAVPDTAISDVVRNHIYEFTIRLAEMTFVPTVKDWQWGGKVHIELE